MKKFYSVRLKKVCCFVSMMMLLLGMQYNAAAALLLWQNPAWFIPNRSLEYSRLTRTSLEARARNSGVQSCFLSLTSYFAFCRFARKLLFILWRITPTIATFPQRTDIVVYLSQRSSVCLPGSMLRRSLSYRFPICFPHFSLCERETKGKTIE